MKFTIVDIFVAVVCIIVGFCIAFYPVTFDTDNKTGVQYEIQRLADAFDYYNERRF